MRAKSRLAHLAVALLLTSGLTLAAATPAAAVLVNCKAPRGAAQIDGSSAKSQATTFTYMGNCGTVYVRASYTSVGGANWSPWKSGSKIAQVSYKNTVKGQHKAQYRTTIFSTYPVR